MQRGEHRIAPRARGATFALAAILAAAGPVGGLAAVGACGGRGPREPPVAFFASTPESGADFQRIREAWTAAPHVSDAGDAEDRLQSMLESFLARYPTDGLVPVARGYLAILCMREVPEVDGGARMKDPARARALLDEDGKVPRGSTGDLVAVAEARWKRLHGDPQGALALLEKNVGKSVDPIVRALFQEELVESTIAAKKHFEALGYMSTWLEQVSEEDRDVTRARIVAEIGRMGRSDLEPALESMRADPTHSGYGVEMEKIIVDRLAQIALASNDADLARRLLSPDAGALVIGGDAGIALAELAGTSTGLNVVDGRTIGLLLPTELPALRDEAASVLRGVMWALGLPRGIRRLLAQEPFDAGTATPPAKTPPRVPTPNGKTPRLTCPRPPYVEDPKLDADSEPNAEEEQDDPRRDASAGPTGRPPDRVSLVIRDDAGDAAKNRDALLELVGMGASVIIAALEPATAQAVLKWGDEHDVPIITLAAPQASGGAVPDFGFVLGTPRARVLDAMVRAVPELTHPRIAPIIDDVDRPFVPMHGGDFPPLGWVETPVSCDVTSERAGEPRFPIAKWRSDKYATWLVTGSPTCARDVVDEIANRGGPSGTVGFTLEASTPIPETTLPPGLRVVAASAGAVPQGPVDEPPTSELRRFVSAFGARPDWWTALGRDAATLARLAVMPQALGRTSDAAKVAALRDDVRKRLADARARLWTTDARGFDATRAMPRDVCVMDLP